MSFGAVGFVDLAERTASPVRDDAHPPIRSATPVAPFADRRNQSGRLDGSAVLIVPSFAAGFWATAAGIAGEALGEPVSTDVLIIIGAATFLPMLVVMAFLARASGSRSE